MKVTIEYPRWHEEHSLITRILEDVCGEGGDGWSWIQTSDPNKWSTIVYNELLSLGNQKEDIVIEFVDRKYIIGIGQECWVFSTKECDCPEFYDAIYRIE